MLFSKTIIIIANNNQSMIPQEILPFVLIPIALFLIIVFVMIRRFWKRFSFWFDSDILEVHFEQPTKLRGIYMEELHIPYDEFYQWLNKKEFNTKRDSFYDKRTNKHFECYVVLSKEEYRRQDTKIIKKHLKIYIYLYKKSKL